MNRYCNRLTQIQRRLVALLMNRYCMRLRQTQIQRRLVAHWMNRYCNRLTQIQRRLVALLMDRYCTRLTQIQRRLAALLTNRYCVGENPQRDQVTYPSLPLALLGPLPWSLDLSRPRTALQEGRRTCNGCRTSYRLR